MTDTGTAGTTGEGGVGGATKLCPYCAETIKAAAIKCRYCQSDLEPAVEPADPPVVAAEQPADPPVVAAEQPADPPVVAAAVAPRTLGRTGLALVGVTAVVVLALLATAFWLWTDASKIEDSRQAGRTARAAVAEKVETLLTYDHSTFDDDFAAAEKVMTDSFLEEYTPTMEAIRDRAVQQRRSQQAEVIAVSVISQSADEVETLLFVDTVSSREGADEQRLLQNRVKVTLVRQDGTWLIDDLDVPQS